MTKMIIKQIIKPQSPRICRQHMPIMSYNSPYGTVS